jgi:hypothetical protein
MTNEEYVKRIGQLYDKILSLRNDDDYAINQPQMDKLLDVLNFFLDVAEKNDGKVEPVQLVPKAEHGGVTATFVVFDIFGDDIQRYCDVMRHTSAITIDSTNEGSICISVTVPEVFTPINH